jgi:hypothetical protein
MARYIGPTALSPRSAAARNEVRRALNSAETGLVVRFFVAIVV